MNGTTPLHLELEARLATLLGTESALIFSSGFMANLGAISGICDSETVIVTDQLNHMSIMDGCRLAESKVKIFSHNSMDKLEYILERDSAAAKQFILVDGVYSMHGDLAPLHQISELAGRYGAMLMVDEAHGLGVVGSSGRGTAEHFGRLTAAYAAASESTRLAHETGNPLWQYRGVAVLAFVHAMRGDEAACRQSAAEAERLGERLGDTSARLYR